MKKIYLAFGLLILISCSDSKTRKILSTVDDFSEEPKELIHPELRKGIEEFLNPRFFEIYPGINMQESCLILYSVVDSSKKDIYFSDSTILITFNVAMDNTDYINYYKGIINVNEQNVAIFDSANIAASYYNTDSLLPMGFNDFRSYSTNIIMARRYYIKNGELKYWNP